MPHIQHTTTFSLASRSAFIFAYSASAALIDEMSPIFTTSAITRSYSSGSDGVEGEGRRRAARSAGNLVGSM
jgi:hypothetical protein